MCSNTMTQERLNHVMLLHTHKDHTDNINLLETVRDYNIHLWPIVFLIIIVVIFFEQRDQERLTC